MLLHPSLLEALLGRTVEHSTVLGPVVAGAQQSPEQDVASMDLHEPGNFILIACVEGECTTFEANVRNVLSGLMLGRSHLTTVASSSLLTACTHQEFVEEMFNKTFNEARNPENSWLPESN